VKPPPLPPPPAPQLDLSPPPSPAPRAAPSEPPKVVLWVSRKGSELVHPRPGALSLAEQERVLALRRHNFAVVLLDVSGHSSRSPFLSRATAAAAAAAASVCLCGCGPHHRQGCMYVVATHSSNVRDYLFKDTIIVSLHPL
jgi:hypothetical protein